jgi:hypothetical protein
LKRMPLKITPARAHGVAGGVLRAKRSDGVKGLETKTKGIDLLVTRATGRLAVGRHQELARRQGRIRSFGATGLLASASFIERAPVRPPHAAAAKAKRLQTRGAPRAGGAGS